MVDDITHAEITEEKIINSTQGTYNDDILRCTGMRESGTPLTALSGAISYHQGGWFIDLNGNYYDRIYLKPLSNSSTLNSFTRNYFLLNTNPQILKRYLR